MADATVSLPKMSAFDGVSLPLGPLTAASNGVVSLPKGLLPVPSASDAFLRTSQQAELRTAQVQPLVQYLITQLSRSFQRDTVRVQLYGSLHHGLHVPHTSKISIDVSVSRDATAAHNVLHILASLPHRDQDSCPYLTYPVLVWHRTAQRSMMLIFYWNGTLVHVTHNNRAGVAVSELMWRTLATNPYLLLTLLHWKAQLRAHTDMLGPNHGQVSMYAVFTMLLRYLPELSRAATLGEYELSARHVVTVHLGMVPRIVRTSDTLAENINLTARSFLAPDMARYLLNIPTLS